MTFSTSLIFAGCMSCMNLVLIMGYTYMQLSMSLSYLTGSEHPTSVWKVVGLIPVGDPDCFLCHMLVA